MFHCEQSLPHHVNSFLISGWSFFIETTERCVRFPKRSAPIVLTTELSKPILHQWNWCCSILERQLFFGIKKGYFCKNYTCWFHNIHLFLIWPQFTLFSLSFLIYPSRLVSTIYLLLHSDGFEYGIGMICSLYLICMHFIVIYPKSLQNFDISNKIWS